MKGVTAYLDGNEDGTLKLLLDDVEATSGGNAPDWKHIVPFTSRTYDAKSVKELSLSKDQFAEIGETLVIRLLALGGRIK